MDTWAEGDGRRPLPLGPGAAPLFLTSADGVPLVGAHYSPSMRSSEAIVLVHGFSGAHDQARVARIARRLQQRCGVVSVTLRGHGRSGGRTTIGHREPMDVGAAVEWARREGYERVSTVGFSMGAAVVLRHGALFASHADAVVAVSGPAYWYYRGTPPMRWLHRGVETRVGRAYLRGALNVRVDPTRWPVPPPMSPTEAAAKIASSGTPLLVVHGDADGFFPLDHPRALQAAAPDSTLWIEPGFGHAEGAITADLVDRIGDWVVVAQSGAGRGSE